MRIVTTALAMAAGVLLSCPEARAQAQPAGVPGGAQISIPAPEPRPTLGRIEISGFDNVVSNGLGHWYGGGVHLFVDPVPRVGLSAEALVQRRPGETEPLGGFGTAIRWTDWFSTHLNVSGGGPDDPAAFYPRVRYDANATLRTPIPGMLLTGGWTRIYFGNPVSGRIARAGFVQYAGKVVFQGSVNFYNSRPGNRKSVSGNGAIQFGQEGRYWVGFSGGGGTEAWQTQGIAPVDVDFSGYSAGFFTRKWITPSFGLAGSYNYFIKRRAYHYNGAEVRLFWQF